MGTLIVLLLLAAAVGFSIHSMVRDKRRGKSLQCGGDCRHCGGNCAANQPANPSVPVR